MDENVINRADDNAAAAAAANDDDDCYNLVTIIITVMGAVWLTW